MIRLVWVSYTINGTTQHIVLRGENPDMQREGDTLIVRFPTVGEIVEGTERGLRPGTRGHAMTFAHADLAILFTEGKKDPCETPPTTTDSWPNTGPDSTNPPGRQRCWNHQIWVCQSCPCHFCSPDSEPCPHRPS